MKVVERGGEREEKVVRVVMDLKEFHIVGIIIPWSSVCKAESRD